MFVTRLKRVGVEYARACLNGKFATFRSPRAVKHGRVCFSDGDVDDLIVNYHVNQLHGSVTAYLSREVTFKLLTFESS